MDGDELLLKGSGVAGLLSFTRRLQIFFLKTQILGDIENLHIWNCWQRVLRFVGLVGSTSWL